MDGPAFYAELARRQLALTGRVALITGDVLSDDMADFLAREGVPSLGQPFTMEELQAVVGLLLGRWAGPSGSCPPVRPSGACDHDRR